MHSYNSPTDEELLTSDDTEAFGLFYDRHVRALLRYFARRAGSPEVAADLTAETFASALLARRRFKPGGPPAAAWLYAIASAHGGPWRSCQPPPSCTWSRATGASSSCAAASTQSARAAPRAGLVMTTSDRARYP
jgi:hypothetical protein